MISLGGTIAMTAQGKDAGVSPALGAEDLLAAVPSLAETGIRLRARNFRALPGASLGWDDLVELVGVIETEVHDGAAGVVITQGTDTIEETAYFLDLTADVPAPIVVTGAMRNPTLAGADGPANLLAAVQLAASGHRELGCVVVLADEIHAARHVRKMHATSTSAFTSPNTGPIGSVVEGVPRLLTHPGPRTLVPIPSTMDSVRVPVMPTYLADDGTVLRLISPACDGLIVAGFGVGHVPAALVPDLAELAGRVPVVLASRTGAGPVLRRTYGFPGSEQDLQDRGLINAGFLAPEKARILLHLLIAAGANTDTVRATFEKAAGGPVTWPARRWDTSPR